MADPIKSKSYVLVIDDERDQIISLLLRLANERRGHLLHHLKTDKLYDTFVPFFKEINIKAHKAGMCTETGCLYTTDEAAIGGDVMVSPPPHGLRASSNEAGEGAGRGRNARASGSRLTGSRNHCSDRRLYDPAYGARPVGSNCKTNAARLT